MGFKMTDFKNNSLYHRVNKLLISDEWSDCSFLIDGKNFKAHKLILGISSPVFEAMFYGPLSTNTPITITDIDPNIFQLLLKYVYTDKVEIQSIEEAYDLLYVSRKYLLECLTEDCITYIHTNLSIDNVISVLNYPDCMQDTILVQSALKLFSRYADYLLRENKTSINSHCMKKLLKCKEINISEKELIKHVFDWTNYLCEQNEIVNSFENRRDLLISNGLFKRLRFYVLSIQELEEVTTYKNNILLSHEADNIWQIIKNPEKILNKDMDVINKKLSPRRSLKYSWSQCHRPPIRSESPMIIDLNNCTVHARIKSNSTTFINFLNMQSRMAPVMVYCTNVTTAYPEHFSIVIMCEEDNSIIKKMIFKKSVDYDSNINIEFDAPIVLKKDLWYKISFIWPQSDTFYHYSYGVVCRDLCYSNGRIKFEFDDILTLSNNSGSFLRGFKFCS